MVSRRATSKTFPLAYISSGVLIAVVLAAGLFYLRRPGAETMQNGPASPEARAYVSNLVLADVSMKATENFMKQQVVEIEGTLTNHGSRPVKSVDVYCLFRGVDGRETHRERVPLARSTAAPIKPKDTRPFRLALDSLPDGSNLRMTRLGISLPTFDV